MCRKSYYRLGYNKINNKRFFKRIYIPNNKKKSNDFTNYNGGLNFMDYKDLANLYSNYVKTLLSVFRNTEDKGLKRSYAEAIKNIDNTAFLKEASNDQIKARKIMQDWLTHNPS